MSEAAENEAWRQVTRRVASPTWRLWAAGVDRADCLTPLGRETLHWAAHRIARFLGPDWLARAIAHGGCPLMTHETWPTVDIPHVHANILDLALRLELVGRAPGIYELRSLTQPHDRWERWKHFLAQVRIGSGAVLAGWAVEFEPKLEGAKSADIRMLREERLIDLEVAHLRLPDSFLEADEFKSTVRERLFKLETRFGVYISATIQGAPPAEVNQWLADVEERARAVSEGGGTSVVGGPHGLEAVIEPSGPPLPSTKLTGPRTSFNAVQRLYRVILKKSKQVEMSDAAWIVVEDGSGLWQLEWWRDLTNPERLDLFCALIDQLDVAASVRGVVLTHMARHMGQRDFAQVLGSAAHLGRALPTGRFRETLIRTVGPPESLTTMYALHDDEVTFLETATQRVLSIELGKCFSGTFGKPPP